MQQNWNAMLAGVAEANEKALGAASALNRITTRTQGLLARRQLAALEDCLDAGAKHFKVAAESQDPQEALKRHTEVAVELGEKLVAATQESFAIQVQAREDLARWLEDGMTTLTSEAESVMKPALDAVTAAPAAPTPARRSPRTTKKAS